MKKPTEIQGLLVKDSRTFYYLETGTHRVVSALDRIQSVLLSRDILSYTGTRDDVTEEKTKKMTLAEAQEKGYKVEVLYLTNHVKTMVKEEPAPEVAKIAWGKK